MPVLDSLPTTCMRGQTAHHGRRAPPGDQLLWQVHHHKGDSEAGEIS
jgi:hypothetical protein